MTTEVASDLDVTVSCLGEGNQNKSDADRPKKPDRASHEEGQQDPPQVDSKHQKQGDMESKADGLSTDSTNDKENEQNASSQKAETAKKKVIEAPPPKVNPWTKRNACPPNNATNSSLQTGREFMPTTHIYTSNSIYSHAHMCSVSSHVLLQSGAAIKLLSDHFNSVFCILVHLCFETYGNVGYSLI